MTNKTFTFSTGHSVEYIPVAYRLWQAVYKSLPRPKPPTQMIEVAGVMREEENTAHPDYQKAMGDHYVALEALNRDFMLKRGVVFEMDDVKRTAVTQLRQDMAELGMATQADGTPVLHEDDRKCWLYDIAIGTPTDEAMLYALIRGESQPTEEHVQAAIATFQGDVSG